MLSWVAVNTIVVVIDLKISFSVNSEAFHLSTTDPLKNGKSGIKSRYIVFSTMVPSSAEKSPRSIL